MPGGQRAEVGHGTESGSGTRILPDGTCGAPGGGKGDRALGGVGDPPPDTAREVPVKFWGREGRQGGCRPGRCLGRGLLSENTAEEKAPKPCARAQDGKGRVRS